MNESQNRSQRLPLPTSCPKEGAWLRKERFYYQSPKIFAAHSGFDEDELEKTKRSFRSPLFEQCPPGALCVEFCSGTGMWIEQRARLSPDCHWIAVERRLDRAHKIWLKQQRSGLSNLTVACAEASFFCQLHLPDHSVEQCFINFPDPWPKARHAKHRLLKDSFLRQLSTILLPAGHLFISTDDEKAIERLQANLDQEGSFSYQVHRFLPDQPFEAYGTSYFESLWRSKGKLIYLVHCRLKVQCQKIAEECFQS